MPDFDQLVVGPEVQRAPQPEIVQASSVEVGEVMERVAPVDLTPTDGPSVRRRVAAEVPEVQRPRQRDASLAHAFAPAPLAEGVRREAFEIHEDEDAFGFGAEPVTGVEGAHGPDLAAVDAEGASGDPQLGVERRRAPVDDGQRAGHGADPGDDVGHAQELVEETGDDPAVDAAGRSLVGGAEEPVAPHAAVVALAMNGWGERAEQPDHGAEREEVVRLELGEGSRRHRRRPGPGGGLEEIRGLLHERRGVGQHRRVARRAGRRGRCCDATPR